MEQTYSWYSHHSLIHRAQGEVTSSLTNSQDLRSFLITLKAPLGIPDLVENIYFSPASAAEVLFLNNFPVEFCSEANIRNLCCKGHITLKV